MSLKFNGSTDRATVGVNLGGYNICSVAFWASWDQAYANDDDFLIEYTTDTNTNNGFYLDPNAASGFFAMQFTDLATGSGSYSWRHNRSDFTINTWHHVLAVFSYPAGAVLYVDGLYVTPNSTSGVLPNTAATFTSSLFHLFHRGNGPGLFGAGKIAELSIWAGTNVGILSDVHAAALYRGLSPFDIPTQMQLLGYYPLDNAFDGYRNRIANKPSPVGFSGGSPSNAPHNMPVNLSTADKNVAIPIGGEAQLAAKIWVGM